MSMVITRFVSSAIGDLKFVSVRLVAFLGRSGFELAATFGLLRNRFFQLELFNDCHRPP